MTRLRGGVVVVVLSLLTHAAAIGYLLTKIVPVRLVVEQTITVNLVAPPEPIPAAATAPAMTLPPEAKVVPRSEPKPIPAPKPAVVKSRVKPVAKPVVSNRAPTQPKKSVVENGIPAAGVAKAGAAQGKPVTIVAARFDADYLQNPSPRYPPLARRLREQGLVLLRVHVLPNGLPSKVEVKQSSGSPRLDASALEAVGQWRFVPARQGDKPVASWVAVPVSFSLGV